MKKPNKMNEAFWLLGNMFCALGIALCTKAGFGLSMIAAPPFILNQFLVKLSPIFTQGTCEYIFQAVLLIIMCFIVGKFKWKYMLSFATAFIFGNFVDGALWLLGGQGVYPVLWMRVVAFAAGELLTAFAIACYFKTSLPLAVYELFVVETARRFLKPTHKIKLGYDYAMLALSLIMTFALFRGFVGVGIGTVILTLVNSHIIRLWGRLLDKFFGTEPLFPRLTNALKQ